jgi:hypothetical protein
MKKKLLKVGDVFDVKSGWNVETSIPEKFVYTNSHSSKLTDHVITVNNAYSNDKNDTFIDDLVKDIIEVFDNEGIKMRYETALNFVYQNTEEIRLESEDEKFILEPGIFVVVETKLTGGGTGHGQHDVYPDGWQITAKRLKDGQYDENGDEIKFFQSGSFAHLVNVNIPVLRTMKKETKFV